MIAEKAPEMDKAIRHLRVLSADEMAKQLEEERLSGISLRKTLERTARDEGRIEGSVEALYKDMGLSTEEISKKLNVDEDYIIKLIKELS